MVPDHYELLGLTTQATATDIRAAYRRKAKELHPDISTDRDAHKKMALVNKAYEVLSDPTSRQQYDRTRARSGKSGPTPRSSPPKPSRPPERKPPTAAAMKARDAEQAREATRVRVAEKMRAAERIRAAETVRAAEELRAAEQAPAQDYYAVLGLTPNASAEATRAAYQRAAEHWRTHRQNTSGAAGVPAVVSRAYALLSNPVARRDYDRLRTRAGQPHRPPASAVPSDRRRSRGPTPSTASNGPSAGPVPPPARRLFAERYSLSEAEGMARYLTELHKYVGSDRTSLDRVTRDDKDGAIIEGWLTQRLGTPDGQWLREARDAMRRNDLSGAAAALNALSTAEEATPRRSPAPAPPKVRQVR